MSSLHDVSYDPNGQKQEPQRTGETANRARSQELNDVVFKEIPVENRAPLFALKLNGTIITPATASRAMLEQQLLQMSEDDKRLAEIVNVDVNGNELLLG